MISKVSIRNFKCLRDVQIELERFTVFVGPNASGKSSILQALNFLSRSFQGQEGLLEGELSQALSRAANDNVELAAECAGKGYRYRSRFPSPPSPSWSGTGRGVAVELNSADWEHWMPSQTNQTPLPLSVLLRLENSKLVQANLVSGDAMASDGSGLHSALANMALNDPDAWQQLQEDLRRIIPTIRRLRHTKTGMMNQPAALLFDTVGAESLPASQVSEGTLLVLGLLAALYAPGRPSLILLDDLD